ncbi:phage holin family protein [Methanobrevibacter sp. DSM 116169]|uniref:phage holin family protein n=1 Tax=Methanobrevibacter sp. DSM 116169 TaxID=3242727 RepID=UPI0038FC6897
MALSKKNRKKVEELEKFSLKDIIKRILVVLIADMIGFLVLYEANIGIHLNANNILENVIFIIIISLLNSLLWIILTNYFMPFLIYTLGIGTFVLNGIILYLVSNFFPGIYFTNFALLITPLLLSILTTFISTVLTVDDDTSYFRAVVRNSLKRKKNKIKSYPGIVILEIDGLSEEILKEAISKGHMPTLKKWVDNKSHIVKEWETDLSSQTGASQAGILHGNNENLVAFRWVDKENGNKIVESTGINDAPRIEKGISNGDGLLVDKGASRCNLFSGDAKDVIFTYSQLFNIRGTYNSAWFAFYSHPNNFPRILILFFRDIYTEIKSQIKHVVKRINPRINRSWKYIPTRAFANIFMREITTQTIIGDMAIGEIDSSYSTYLGYDEVAHHSGINDEDVWPVLRGIDKQIYRLERVNEITERDYYFVIQSDHGQGNGNTFKQRYGIKFENYVRSFLPEDMKMFSKMSSNDDHFKSAFVPHTNYTKQLRETYSTSLEYIKNHDPLQISNKKPKESEIIVLASGNLALIYFTQWKKRLYYEDIILSFPELIPGLVHHEGIGFVLVNSKRRGGMIIGDKGIYYLEDDKVEGENPLKDFGENAAHHLRRTNSFKNVPDILVNSFYDPESEEICAFEELIGSHGGLGGSQTKPFIMYPSNWEINEELIGAESIYKVLKKQIKKVKEE